MLPGAAGHGVSLAVACDWPWPALGSESVRGPPPHGMAIILFWTSPCSMRLADGCVLVFLPYCVPRGSEPVSLAIEFQFGAKNGKTPNFHS